MILLRILLGLLALILLLLLTAVIHTLLTPSRKSAYVPVPEPERAMIYARKLSRMIQTETVSRPDTDLLLSVSNCTAFCVYRNCQGT